MAGDLHGGFHVGFRGFEKMQRLKMKAILGSSIGSVFSGWALNIVISVVASVNDGEAPGIYLDVGFRLQLRKGGSGIKTMRLGPLHHDIERDIAIFSMNRKENHLLLQKGPVQKEITTSEQHFSGANS